MMDSGGRPVKEPWSEIEVQIDCSLVPTDYNPSGFAGGAFLQILVYSIVEARTLRWRNNSGNLLRILQQKKPAHQ